MNSILFFDRSQSFANIARATLAALALLAAGESSATVYYGKMTGTVNNYLNTSADPIDFNYWLFGDNRSPLGLTIEVSFSISDQNSANGGNPTPVVNSSSDPLHYGTYTGSLGTSSQFGNISVSSILVDGKSLPQFQATFKQTLVNDLAPGDKFAFEASYFTSMAGNLNFSVQTLQNILNSGYTTQEFYWLRSNDPTADATGQLKTSKSYPVSANYDFLVDRLSLTLSQNPEPPTIPVPAAGWLMGSALLGLARFARRR